VPGKAASPLLPAGGQSLSAVAPGGYIAGMRATTIIAVALIAALLPAAPALAYMVYPDRQNPKNLILLIERGTGDLVRFASLPPPFNVALQSVQGPGRFSFRWIYAPGQFGVAYLDVDERGQGVLTVEFSDTRIVDGDSFGAAAVLVSKSGRPLHTFYARADVREASFEGQADRQQYRLALERSPEWWRDVGAISFFYMKYAKYQRLDDAAKWRAMRSVVQITTKGEGSEQRQ
jgi:hypothetical protein